MWARSGIYDQGRESECIPCFLLLIDEVKMRDKQTGNLAMMEGVPEMEGTVRRKDLCASARSAARSNPTTSSTNLSGESV